MGHQEAKSDSAFSVCCCQSLPDAPVLDAPSSSISFNKELTIDTANILQSLVFLSNLIQANAVDPAKVRAYAHLAEEKVRELGELIRPMLWNPARHAGEIESHLLSKVGP